VVGIGRMVDRGVDMDHLFII